MGSEHRTGLPRPRLRRLLSTVALILPVLLFIGAAAWFFRTHIAPPTVAIQPMVLASLGSMPAPEPPRPEPRPAALSAAELPRAEPHFGRLMMLSLSVAPPFGASQTTAPLTEIFAAARDPIAGPIPLPPPRPRISSAVVRETVPVPRPRPAP